MCGDVRTDSSHLSLGMLPLSEPSRCYLFIGSIYLRVTAYRQSFLCGDKMKQMENVRVSEPDFTNTIRECFKGMCDSEVNL